VNGYKQVLSCIVACLLMEMPDTGWGGGLMFEESGTCECVCGTNC
jgi:hypothetical protein